MASSASAKDMAPHDGADEPLIHGGNLGAARRLFPGAPEPFIDLSTGINPHPYPLPRFKASLFARLPEPDATAALATAAARAYGASDATHVACAPGAQILLPVVAALVRPSRAAVLEPSYAEHARAAKLAGHDVKTIRNIGTVGDAALVMLAHPNNPDGRLLTRKELLLLADGVSRRGGLLVIDEAFMDVGPPGASLAAEIGRGSIVVLRSFGKFFGLAGLRLGFALAAPSIVRRLNAALGPWAVSGPALAAGTKALADTTWIAQTRKRLAKKAEKLDKTLAAHGLTIAGGTSLFRLVRRPSATALFQHLGRAGILTRAFPNEPDWLRFGLPASEHEWRRLDVALERFASSRSRAP